MIFLIGCSSTYTISDFSSKDKFYDDFNNFADNKTLKITLNNDSSFISNEGTKITNDSLILLYQYQSNTIDTVHQQDIKKIIDYYDEYSNHSIKILLADGKEIKEKNIEYLPDSSIKIAVTKILNDNKSIPLINVKKISYNRHWIGLISGFFAGIPLGVVVEVSHVLPVHVDEGNPPKSTYDDINGTLIAIPLGILIGSVVGWIVGYNYTYQFNP
jgi:hypothetical protein